MAAKIKLFFRYILNLGLPEGIRIFYSLEILRKERIKMNHFQYPVLIRRGTSDAQVFREVFLYKSYDIPLSSARVIVDGGANTGLSALYLVQKFKGATVYSIEPDKDNFEILVRNSAQTPSIVPVHAALWNRDTSLRIKSKNEYTWAYEVVENSGDKTESIPGLTIAFLMKDFNLDHIDLLKLDIEGSEKEVFSSNYDSWLTRTRNIIIELHDWRKTGSSKALFTALSGYNFNTSVINGMLFLTNQDLVTPCVG